MTAKSSNDDDDDDETYILRSDHKAIFLLLLMTKSVPAKTTSQRTYRAHTPTYHALFLQHVSAELFDNTNPSTDTQREFDLFCDKLLDFFNNFHP